ncbi:MAG: TatD family hydrolase [Candidatus Promineofilum sp.]|nr:TatD family hydrolase [Promineifilum sp.]
MGDRPDYYWDKTPPATQKRALTQQLELAAELGLPVIIHNRDASEDVVRLLSELVTVTGLRPRCGVCSTPSPPTGSRPRRRWAWASTWASLGR